MSHGRLVGTFAQTLSGQAHTFVHSGGTCSRDLGPPLPVVVREHRDVRDELPRRAAIRRTLPYARHEHLRRAGAPYRDLQDAQHTFRGAVAAYLGAIILGLIFPLVGIVFYFAIAVVLVVPFKAVAQAVLGARRARR